MATADVQIPSHHKGVVYDKPGSLSLKLVEDLTTPEPGPGQVLVHLTHSGVCHSDYSVMTNGWKWLPYPTQEGQVGGHEGVGTVVKLGTGSDTHVKVGDRVGIKWVSAACGSCLPCLGGRDGCCFNGQISGYYTPGTFQQYALGPANYVTKIPDALESAAAAPLLCGGVTVYAGLKKTGAIPGDYVVISGAGGGLGHLACQIAAKGMGFRTIGIDHSSKEKLARDGGCEHFFGFDKTENMAQAVKDAAGGLGAKAVLVLNASEAAYAQAIDFLRIGGKLIVIGVPEGDLKPIAGVIPGVMVAKELTVEGSAVGNRRDAMETLDLAARGVIKMHYRIEKMDKLKEIFEQMHAGKLEGRVVLDLS